MSYVGHRSELEEKLYDSACAIISRLNKDKDLALVDVGPQNFLRRGADTGGGMVLVDVDRAVLNATEAMMQQDLEEMRAWRRYIVRP